MTNNISFLQDFLQDKRLTYINGLYIVTDEPSYKGLDQVLPRYPKQLFFFAERNSPQIQATVLEIGLGSGVLSIGCVKAGAKQVTALEINPRAKELAKFNFGHLLVYGQCH